MSSSRRGSLVDSASVRRANTDLVTAALRDHGPLTRSQLLARTGLTRPTVAVIVQALLVADVVCEQRPAVLGETKAGRPPTVLDLNPRRTLVATCLFRLDGIQVRLLDARGALLAETVVDSADIATVDARVTLGRVARAVRSLVTQIPDAGSLAAVSVVVAGLVNTTSGVCLAFPPFNWVDVPVRAFLERALGVSVAVLNPSHAAVLGEVVDGSAVGHADVVLVFYDHGISAGIVSGGRLLTGSVGATGELGHCVLPAPTDRDASDRVSSDRGALTRGARNRRPVCSFGHRDCLEAVASGTRVLSRARAVAGSRARRAHTVAALEALHHPGVDQVLADAAQDLGTAASWLVNLLNPSVVVLGGTRFTEGAQDFLSTFSAQLERHSIAGNQVALTVRPAHPDADVRGARHAALELLPASIAPHSTFHVTPAARG